MAGFHLLVYDAATGAAVTAQDLAAAVDPVFTQRNGHITLTDNIQLLAAQVMAAALTRASIRTPTWNAQTLFAVDPIQLSATQPNPPLFADYLDMRPTIPQDEELQIVVADTQAAGEVITAGLIVCTPDWSRNIPRGTGPLSYFTCRVTATLATTARAWSPVTALTFEQGLRSGVYAVVDANFYIASALYFRMLFPRSTMYGSRALRPGSLIRNAMGNQPFAPFSMRTSPWGVWGKFQTFEPPQIEVWSSATVGSATYEGRLSLVKISDSSDPGAVGA